MMGLIQLILPIPPLLLHGTLLDILLYVSASVSTMLYARRRLLTTPSASERIVKINPKSTIAAIHDQEVSGSEVPKKKPPKVQELSHRLRIVQDVVLGSSRH